MTSKTSNRKRVVARKAATTAHSANGVLGELDLHLFGEGKHDRIYEKLGAHVLTHEGRRGDALAACAPSANHVRVVGNFNGCNGASQLMRQLGNPGVWVLLSSRLTSGELYKYE